MNDSRTSAPKFDFRKTRKLFVALLATTFLTTALLPISATAAEAKVMVQLNGYEGHEAYFALYLIDPDGRYNQTLWVSGDDKKYHPDLPRWWKYLSRNPQDIDAITGASTAGGDRSTFKVEIADELIDAGYSLRVETAVEDAEAFTKDVEAELSTANVGEKVPGTGYVRFIRFKL